jgi:tetratricopeptide (TPR) repeat protein
MISRRTQWILLITVSPVVVAVFLATRPSRDPAKLYREAQAALRSGRPTRADRLMRQLAEVRVPRDEDWMLRSRIATANGQTSKALAGLARIRDASPLGPEARLSAGQLELRQHHARAAESQLRRALELDPKLVQARRELIYLYGTQIRGRELSRQVEALAEATTITFRDVFLWCLSRGFDWDPVEQVPDLEAFVKADSADRWSRLALADSLQNLARLDEAEQVLAHLPEQDPDARVARARIAMARDQLERASALLEGAVQDHLGVSRLRGRLALSHGDGPTALRHFRAAEKLDPFDRDTLRGLAQALSITGEQAEAGRYARLAQKYDALSSLLQRAGTPYGRRDPALPGQLGAACEDLGLIPEARAWYKLAVARNPLDQTAQQALYRLAANNETKRASVP